MSETICYNCQTLLDPQATKCANCGQPQILRGRYRIKRLLGQGGFGVVYEAYDIDLQRHYAIKLINVMSPAMREQVTVEAQILAQHARRFPFIPEIYDIWTEANYLILVMEYVGGATLGSLIEKHGAFPPKSVGQFLYAMLGHLDQLHKLGIIHRDIKPENIKRTDDNRYVLLDFGIAKRSTSTEIGAKAFSLYYASPEQSRGKATDARSDLFSLGATAYHLATGHAPTPADSRIAMKSELPPPSHFYPAIPPVLDRVIMQLLELDPANRPQTAKDAMTTLTTKPAAPKPATPPPAEPLIVRPALESSAGKPTIAIQPTVQPAITPEAQAVAPVADVATPSKRGGSKFMWMVGALVLAFIVTGAIILNRSRSPQYQATATSMAIVQPSATREVQTTATIAPSMTAEPTLTTIAPSMTPAVTQAVVVPASEIPTVAPSPTTAPTATTQPSATPEPTANPFDQRSQDIARLINEQRVSRGLTPLTLNLKLTAAAQRHSNDMANNNFFAANGSDGSTIDSRLRDAGYVGTRWIQHIAAGMASPEEAVTNLANTPSNFDNMIDPDLRELGVGYAENANSQFGRYWTIVYAKP